jgi:hypothetical protein
MPVNFKKDLLQKIENLKATNEAFSKIISFDSLSSVSRENPLDFILDLFILLFGGNKTKSDFIKFLISEIKLLNDDLFKYFKENIVKFYQCKTDTQIPAHFFQFKTFKITELDFFGLLKIDPDSPEGKSYYVDYPDNLDKLIYQAINNQGIEYNWKSVLVIKYLNQELYVKLDSSLQGKTIYNFVNLYMSNTVLFDNKVVVSDLIDSNFGVLTSKLKNTLANFSKKNLNNQIELEIILERITDSFNVDDSFFTFDTEEVNDRAEKRKDGYYEFIDCEVNYVSYDYDLLQSFMTDLINVSQYNEEIYTINFDYLVNQTSGMVLPSDKQAYTDNLFKLFFKIVIKSITRNILTPKNILFIRLFALMSINANIGADFKDFFKEHRKFLIDIIKKRIIQAVIRYLVIIIIRELNEMIQENNLKKEQEQLRLQILQIRSLLSII